MLDCVAIREDFEVIGKEGIAYLDNAASTLKPRQVIEAIAEFMRGSYANVHRGVHRLSVKASEAYESAHEVVAKFIGAGSWEEVVFLRNTTEASQLLIETLVANGVIGKGDEVVLTEAEHHSILLPWLRAVRRVGARPRILPVDDEGVPEWGMLDEFLSERTRAVVFAHVSNVTGYVTDVKEVVRRARSVGALVVLDAAQSVPHMPFDVKELGIDFAMFSGHKMLGPTGIGVLWGRADLLRELEPPLGGGGTVRDVRLVGSEAEVAWDDPPWRFEAGTPPIIEAVGLTEAVNYLRRLGMGNVARHERELTALALKKITEIEGIEVVGPKDPSRRHGIVSFVIEGHNPDTIGVWLDVRRIAVRTGKHCAHPLHHRLGLEGTVRASFYIYNCVDDVERLISALREYVARYGSGL